MIDGQTSADARQSGTRMLSPPPVLHFAKPNDIVASCRLSNRIGTVLKDRRANVCDRNVRGIP